MTASIHALTSSTTKSDTVVSVENLDLRKVKRRVRKDL